MKKSHIAIATSILFPNFINSFNEKLIFYHYNVWAHDIATKPRVLLATSLMKKKSNKKKKKPQLSTSNQIIQSHNLLSIEKTAFSVTRFCRSLAEHWQKITSCMRCHQSSWNFHRKWVSQPQSTKAQSQSGAEQAGRAKARLSANGNKVRMVYWICLGDLKKGK